MTKGYLLFAVNTDTVDYTRLAYACALSIKLTQPAGYNQVAMVTNIPESISSTAFDHVIPYTGPLGMDARSRALDYTPFEETVLLDADMLLLKDMSHYWDIVSTKDLFISTCAQTYRGERIHYGAYREIFKQNNLLDTYNAWTYFKKDSAMVQEFFETVKLITDYPNRFMDSLAGINAFSKLATDEAFALAIGILDIDTEATCPEWNFPSIVHMKGKVQGFEQSVDDWADRIRINIDANGQVKLGVWQQTELLHYVNKDVITDTVLKTLEAACSM